MKLRNIIFYVKDIKKSLEFYTSLDFEVIQNFGQFISFKTDCDGTYFSIMQSNSPEKEPGKQVCSFYSSDVEELYKDLKGKKAVIAKDLYEAPFGKTFAIKDVDGNKIEFVEE